MTLLYRAIWQDERDGIVDAAAQAFGAWIADKSLDVVVPDEGLADGHSAQGPVEVMVRRALVGQVEAAQFELSEDRREFGERWTTRMTVIGGEPGDRWLWVDLERVADADAVRPPLAAPKLVRNLLETGTDARVDQVRITASPQRIDPRGLAGLIRNTTRTLPLVVFSEEPAGFEPTMTRAETVAVRLAGAVQVVILPAAEVDALKEVLGDDLAVWGGAARVYLPNAGHRGLRPERHRYVRLDQLVGAPMRPIRILSSLLGAVITARRLPPAYEQVRRELLLGRSRNDAELLTLAEEEIARLTDERDALKDELEALQQDHLDTLIDLEAAVTEASRTRNQLQLMMMRGATDEDVQGAADLACEAGSISEAVALARRLLTNVAVPAGVERDLDDLDGHLNRASWGDLTWRGLRALHCYAAAGYDGNFWQWCEASGHAWAWPATPKKLALRESEQVQNNGRLREQRRFPVDRRVDPSGAVIMWAHLKIAEGGGPMAPRVYFHDDTRGVTGKIHIGFVGPHKYVENTRTN